MPQHSPFTIFVKKMDVEKVRNICITKPLTEECFPFDDCTLVMKVCGKMYAVIPLEQADKVVLKCNPEYADELKEHYFAIEGAWHFNKKYWIQITFNKDAHDNLIEQLIEHSYNEVIKKLTMKIRKENNLL